VLRLLAALLLLQLCAQASGLVRAAQGLACEEIGPEQEGDEDCSPGCADCLCCPQHRLLIRQPVREPTLLDVEELDFPTISLPLAAGVPREIMHVPKSGTTA
jgi:hypothetical protein